MLILVRLHVWSPPRGSVVCHQPASGEGPHRRWMVTDAAGRNLSATGEVPMSADRQIRLQKGCGVVDMDQCQILLAHQTTERTARAEARAVAAENVSAGVGT